MSPSATESLEWLHCNSCFRDPLSFDKNLQLSLQFLNVTECGHIVCQQCFKKDSNNLPSQCPVCQTTCAAVPLGDKFPSKIKHFFRPSISILEETLEVMKFQQTNMLGLIRFLKSKVSKQKEVLNKAKNELLNIKDLRKSIQTLTNENEILKSRLTGVRNAVSTNDGAQQLDDSVSVAQSSKPQLSAHVPVEENQRSRSISRLSLPARGRSFTPSPLLSTSPNFIPRSPIQHSKATIGSRWTKYPRGAKDSYPATKQLEEYPTSNRQPRRFPAPYEDSRPQSRMSEHSQPLLSYPNASNMRRPWVYSSHSNYSQSARDFDSQGRNMRPYTSSTLPFVRNPEGYPHPTNGGYFNNRYASPHQQNYNGPQSIRTPVVRNRSAFPHLGYS
ncbi:hypothetical protein K7432_004882 [Basidiobolus ranarum]|uniref:RING-type domain-containing protein n=1 Tax=Basidiobolus ranarum TaxID=34480 RepID=A0ABR2WXF8_9FUNG